MAPSWIPCAAIATVAGAAGLAVCNPAPHEFAHFAGDQLVEAITQEVCLGTGLPLALKLVLQNCPQLVASQRDALGRLAVQHSTRTNLGLLSVYRTALGGQTLLADLRLPRYEAVTVAGAGHFVVLRTSTQP